MSSPDSIFGQTFNCDDGSTLTYNSNSIFGDTITNNSTDETYTGSFLSTTSDEYEKIFKKDSAMKRRFFNIDVNEPTNEETKKILYNCEQYFRLHTYQIHLSIMRNFLLLDYCLRREIKDWLFMVLLP